MSTAKNMGENPLNKVSSKWLEDTNTELKQKGIAASDRADAAAKKWRKENVSDLIARRNIGVITCPGSR